LLTFLAAFSYSAVKQMQNRKPPAGPVVPKGDDVAMQARQKLAEANPDLKPNFNHNLNSDPTPNLKLTLTLTLMQAQQKLAEADVANAAESKSAK